MLGLVRRRVELSVDGDAFLDRRDARQSGAEPLRREVVLERLVMPDVGHDGPDTPSLALVDDEDGPLLEHSIVVAVVIVGVACGVCGRSIYIGSSIFQGKGVPVRPPFREIIRNVLHAYVFSLATGMSTFEVVVLKRQHDFHISDGESKDALQRVKKLIAWSRRMDKEHNVYVIDSRWVDPFNLRVTLVVTERVPFQWNLTCIWHAFVMRCIRMWCS